VVEQPIGETLDSLGVRLDLEEGHQVTEVLVVAKVVDFNTGATALTLGCNTGLDWVAQLGLSAGAHMILGQDIRGDG
jgi:hypothetical protein